MEYVKTNCKETYTRTKAFMFALVVIGVGVALMLKNMGVMDDYTRDIVFSWPMLVVAIGVMNLNKHSFWFGILLMLFGGFFILVNIYDLPIAFNDVFWPSLFIMFGLLMIYGSLMVYRRKNWTISNSSENLLEEISVFGGSSRIINSKSFRGGDIVCVFGGSKIDLTNADLAEGTHELNFVSIFGGSSLIVPENWNVKVEVVSIFGDFKDKRSHVATDFSKTLIVKGVAVFGGGDIKSW